MSIEDWNPASKRSIPIDVAVARVAAAAAVCDRHGVLLTGRCENLIHGVDDLDDTITGCAAYRAAGAHVAYAPGLTVLADGARVVEAVPGPHNVLALRNGPSVPELASVGVRRVSTGGSLAWAAYGALVAAATELKEQGTSTYLDRALPRGVRNQAFTN